MLCRQNTAAVRRTHMYPRNRLRSLLGFSHSMTLLYFSGSKSQSCSEHRRWVKPQVDSKTRCTGSEDVQINQTHSVFNFEWMYIFLSKGHRFYPSCYICQRNFCPSQRVRQEFHRIHVKGRKKKNLCQFERKINLWQVWGK